MEARALLAVVDRAIDDMKPRGAIHEVIRRVSTYGRNNSTNTESTSTFSFAARVGNMDNTGVQRMYVKLKESISLKLIRLEIAEEEEIAAPKKPGLFNCFKKKEEVKDKRFKLNWQA